ncbi:MAG: hypothetical protein AB7E61_06965 [Acholeplasmataceae bacterium]
MASKGQKFKRYDLEFKLKVLSEYRSGKTESYLSKTYEVPTGTIRT